MHYIAFFRNVNLGHPKSPTRSQLEAAFSEAGAAFAQSFQTNGTLVFFVDAEQSGREIIERVCQTLQGVY